MQYDFFHDQNSIIQIELYKENFFNHFGNFLQNEDITIKKIKEDDDQDPQRIAHFNTKCSVLKKPIIVLHCNRINDYIKKIGDNKKIQYLIELIIYHELSHWFIESFFSREISDQGKQQIYFHEALAQYFTVHLLSINKDKEKKMFFEWFCIDKFSNNEEKKKIYMLWKIDEIDGFELINYNINSVIEAINVCNKQNKQEWKLLKQILTKNINTMPNFNIFGPFHFNDFTENGILRNDAPNKYNIKDENGKPFSIPNLNQPGIYIWGNLFDIDAKRKLLHPSDCSKNNFKYNPNKHQFIPYYVGKIESSLFNRLNQHRNVRQGNAVGYIRFSYDYWKEFFKDPLYERDSQTLINLVRQTKNSVIYHNDIAVLQEIYPQMNIVAIGNNHPITAQLLYNMPIYDTLDAVVNGANNFWFCYLPIGPLSQVNLKSLESEVYYSLKGKTTSFKNNYSKADPTINLIDNTNNSRIFKKIEYKNGTELILALNEFWGY
jgi:hypothetical protein